MPRLTLALAALLAASAAACADPFIEATVELSDTTDTQGPYQVWTVVIGATASDSVELRYSVDDAADLTAQMRHTDDPGDDPGELYRGAILGQAPGSTIHYRIAVVRDGEVVARDPADGAAPFVFSVAQ